MPLPLHGAILAFQLRRRIGHRLYSFFDRQPAGPATVNDVKPTDAAAVRHHLAELQARLQKRQHSQRIVRRARSTE